MDESSLDPRRPGQKRTTGPRGAPRVVVIEQPGASRLNALLMTSVQHEDRPLYAQLLPDTVDGAIFCNFILDAIQRGVVGQGCLVIWDNARIHLARDHLPALQHALHQAGADYVNLPAYSPELNPCEYVFAEVKCFIRQHSRPESTWPERVVEAFESVSYKNMVSYYEHCTVGVVESFINE